MIKRFFSFGREAVDQHKGHSDKICRRRGLSVEQLEPRQLLALTGGTDSFAYFLDAVGMLLAYFWATSGTLVGICLLLAYFRDTAGVFLAYFQQNVGRSMQISFQNFERCENM